MHHVSRSSAGCLAVLFSVNSCLSLAALIRGTDMIFSCPCAKPRPCASSGFNADLGNSAMPICSVLAKSSSWGGSLSFVRYLCSPRKAPIQSSSVWTSSSIRRNNSTCSIGCFANARCIACSVGMSGASSSRFTSRLPNGSPAPFIRVTVIGEYRSAKLVVRKMDSGPS